MCIFLILLVVIIPGLLLGVSLVGEAASLYNRLEAGEIDLALMFSQLRSSLPGWADDLLVSYGWTDLEAMRRMVGSSLSTLLQAIAARALWFGQGALQLLASLGVMLYVAYLLLRDGATIGHNIRRALPLKPHIRDPLIDHFLVVVKATMKGTVVVAILQGLAGGLIFWILGIDAPILWGLLMALFSLFPAVGTGIVWVPVAIYLLATGSIPEGMILIFCGLFVIGLIDNLLRPILVGHDAKLPEFIVLIATIGGLALMGLNGVIIGPIIAAMFLTVWTIFADQREADQVEAADAD
jgi:predicted PurR-regulated permease PerM